MTFSERKFIDLVFYYPRLGNVRVELGFDWTLMWFGAFFGDVPGGHTIWLCLIPMLPLKITWGGWTEVSYP